MSGFWQMTGAVVRLNNMTSFFFNTIINSCVELTAVYIP